MCCSVLQCVAVCCSVLQCVAYVDWRMCYTCETRSWRAMKKTLQHTAILCNTLLSLHSMSHDSFVTLHQSHWLILWHSMYCNTLQHAATHCNTLHCTATHFIRDTPSVTLNETWLIRNTQSVTLSYFVTLNEMTHSWHSRTNTLQHTATHCNTLQHTATHCNTLHQSATCCITLQHTSFVTLYESHSMSHDSFVTLNQWQCLVLWHSMKWLIHNTHMTNTLQHAATHCNTLQHTATHCNILQPVTLHCSTLHSWHSRSYDSFVTLNVWHWLIVWHSMKWLIRDTHWKKNYSFKHSMSGGGKGTYLWYWMTQSFVSECVTLKPLSLPRFLTCTHSLSLSLSLSHTHTRTCTNTCAHTHIHKYTHTHTHTHTHTDAVALSRVLKPGVW